MFNVNISITRLQFENGQSQCRHALLSLGIFAMITFQ